MNAPASSAAACCAAFYEQEWVATLLADSFHPGGTALTQRLVDDLALPSESTVLDLACGTGTTALLLAARGHRVIAVDFSEKNMARVRARAEGAGVADRITSHVADAAALPLRDASVDAVIAECALSTFANKRVAVTQMCRVLRPGGRIGITDMVLNAPLPAHVAEAVGPWACLQDALTVSGYQRLFLEAELRAVHYADESNTLRAMARDLKRKLVVVGLGKMAGALADMDLDIAHSRALLADAVALVNQGVVEYCRLAFCDGVPPVVVPRPIQDACDETPGCC